jgi:hypothetical protein
MDTRNLNYTEDEWVPEGYLQNRKRRMSDSKVPSICLHIYLPFLNLFFQTFPKKSLNSSQKPAQIFLKIKTKLFRKTQ